LINAALTITKSIIKVVVAVSFEIGELAELHKSLSQQHTFIEGRLILETVTFVQLLVVHEKLMDCRSSLQPPRLYVSYEAVKQYCTLTEQFFSVCGTVVMLGPDA
jgi:hypothetical protein